MQSGRQCPHNKADLDPGNWPVGTYTHAQVAPVFPPGAKRLAPLHGFEFHPSEVCPKNFIIFDQTDNRSQIMFHPGIAHKFAPPSFNFRATCFEERNEVNESSDRESSSFPLEEDLDDINALLSSGDEYELDEDEVSTARTHEENCTDTASSYGDGYDYERKRRKMRKMVQALRGIVPGGDQMDDTTSVIDEAVKYLKSLKVEAQKLGVGNLGD